MAILVRVSWHSQFIGEEAKIQTWEGNLFNIRLLAANEARFYSRTLRPQTLCSAPCTRMVLGVPSPWENHRGGYPFKKRAWLSLFLFPRATWGWTACFCDVIAHLRTEVRIQFPQLYTEAFEFPFLLLLLVSQVFSNLLFLTSKLRFPLETSCMFLSAAN